MGTCDSNSICTGGTCSVAPDCTTYGDHTGDTCKCPADSVQNAKKVDADCGTAPVTGCDMDNVDCADPLCAGETGPNGGICCPSGNSDDCAVNGRSSVCASCTAGTFECSYKPATPQSECNSAFLCSDSNKAPNSYGVGDKLLPSNAFCDGSGYCSAVNITGMACADSPSYTGLPPSASQCVDGQEKCKNTRTDGAVCNIDTECAAGYYCTDTDGDGNLGSETTYGGACTKCDGAFGSICGAIAHDGIQYGVCTGSSSGNFYGCADQEMADNTYTVGGTSFNDPLFKTVCQTKGYGGGGIVRTATSNIPTDYDVYTKCGLKSVCSGGATYPSGGDCKPTTASVTEVKLRDGTDNDEDKVSINHKLAITHTIKNGDDSPAWAYEAWCMNLTEVGITTYSRYCAEPGAKNTIVGDWNKYLGIGPARILQPGDTQTIIKKVNLNCDTRLIKSPLMELTYGSGQIGTNSWYALYNGFQAGQYNIQSNPISSSNDIKVVECKTNSDCDACGKTGYYCDNGIEDPLNNNPTFTCQKRLNGMNCGLNPEQCQCIAGNSPKPSPNLITNPGFELN